MTEKTEENYLPLLNSPLQLSSRVTLRNRTAMAPMTRRMCPNNVPYNPTCMGYYARRAQGGCALIITEGVHVNNTTAVDKANSPQCRSEEQIRGWKAVADAVHAAGGAICMQLWHTGPYSQAHVGPSEIPNVVSKALSKADMGRIAFDFAETARCAVAEANFDMVEIHGAHGYLLDSFCDPKFNLRTDDYGGSVAKRALFPSMVVRAVREVVGPDVPISYRFSQWTVADYHSIKWSNSTELAEFLKMLVEAGVNVFHPSTRRLTDPMFPSEHPTRTFAGWTKLLLSQWSESHSTNDPTAQKKHASFFVIGVGSVSLNREYGSDRDYMIADPSPALQLLGNELDIVCVGRPMLTDPDWAAKVLAGGWQSVLPYNEASLKELL